MTHSLEYKMALSPLQQQAARLSYEISLLEKEIIDYAKEFNPATSNERISRIIEGKMFEMKQRTEELLSINLNVYKVRK